MANYVKVLDPKSDNPAIKDLAVGQMFRYLRSKDGKVYMKTRGLNGNDVTDLGTGERYNPDMDAEVQLIKRIEINP